jgi:ATP-dependent DNA ligase
MGRAAAHQLVDAAPEGDQWLREIKYDSYRMHAWLEPGIVAKRLADPYEPRTSWFKIKNPDYSQKEGRGELFNRQR